MLRKEVMELLAPQAGESVLDVTVGLGGHAQAFLEAIGPSGHLIGLDADEENLRVAREQLRAPNVELMHANFRDLQLLSLPQQDIIFADLGLSSPHVDDPSRGFSFRGDAPLDLRFDRRKGVTAAQMLTRFNERQIAGILREYGELDRPAKLARIMGQAEPQTTGAMRACVEEMYGHRAPRVLPQVFQALRIAVNDELGALDIFLIEGPKLLKSGGHMAVISYHSLEDRKVKRAFRQLSTATQDALTGATKEAASFILCTKKPVTPSDEEVRKNPRSRSARLRILQRTLAS